MPESMIIGYLPENVWRDTPLCSITWKDITVKNVRFPVSIPTILRATRIDLVNPDLRYPKVRPVRFSTRETT